MFKLPKGTTIYTWVADGKKFAMVANGKGGSSSKEVK